MESLNLYIKNDLVKTAKRDGNLKREFLLVNSLQGKHLPVSPSKSLELFKNLAGIIKKNYPDEKILAIGFAETATAIGSAVASYLSHSRYIQTTRENIENEKYIIFSETHSHAVEQKLFTKNLKDFIEKTDRIIFVEDEITTGNTIINLKKLLEKEYSDKKLNFGAVSILNGMTDENMENFKKENIDCFYILKLSKENYTDILKKYTYDSGLKYKFEDIQTENLENINNFFINDYIDARLGADAKIYYEKCLSFAEKIIEKYQQQNLFQKNILILGMEEFMYPPMLLGEKMEKELKCRVSFHAPSRSPILPSREKDYPIHVRYEFKSLYDDNRTVFVYNLKKYDKAIIVHDSKNKSVSGINHLINILRKNGCNEIDIFKWGE